MTDPPLPIFLQLAGRRVLVVGAGLVAEKRVHDLIEAGARVRVVAPEATARIAALAAGSALTWERRPFAGVDVDGAWLVVSATGDAETQARVFEEAEARRVFVLAVDDPAHGSAASGAVIRRPPFVIVISSSGEAPALTRLLREVLEQALPSDRWIMAARALRADWKREKTPMGARFAELVRALMKLED